MKKIFLTGKYGSVIGNYALVDNADFDILNKWKWHAGKGRHTFYARTHMTPIVGGAKRKARMHRIILGITDQKVFTDHIDGNGINNQRSNIRVCTNYQNVMNKSGTRTGTSKYKGVSWDKNINKWKACIKFKTNLQLGLFDSEIEAAIVYNEAALKYFKEFAYLNKIP